MIRRLVKMSFKAEAVVQFQALFDTHKDLIRSFEGCEHLELWQDEQHSNVFFTYSHWQGEEFLEAYRHSDLFKGVWSQTKPLFNDRPEAWSTELRAIGSEVE